MRTLHDILRTYEVCLPAEAAPPRPVLEWFERPWARELARTLCTDASNLEIITDVVRDAFGYVATGTELHERFAELLTSGRVVLRDASPSGAARRRDHSPDPIPEPFHARRDDPTLHEDPLRTWISIELVHADGMSTERVELELTTATGRELYGRIDAHGRWRADDIDRGTCRVRLLDHPVLRRRPRPRTSASPPVTPLAHALHEDDIPWPEGSDRPLDLRPTQHHRIVIVPPLHSYFPSF